MLDLNKKNTIIFLNKIKSEAKQEKTQIYIRIRIVHDFFLHIREISLRRVIQERNKGLLVLLARFVVVILQIQISGRVKRNS